MKKSFLVILSAMLTVLCLVLMVTAAAASTYVLGDADGNGDVEVVDVVVVQRIVADMITDQDGSITQRADIDKSGELEVTDATLIQRYLADMVTPYRIGDTVKPKPTSDPYELPIV